MKIDYRKLPLSSGFEYGQGAFGGKLAENLEWDEKVPMLRMRGDVVPEEMARFVLAGDVASIDEDSVFHSIEVYVYGGADAYGWHSFSTAAAWGSCTVEVRERGKGFETYCDEAPEQYCRWEPVDCDEQAEAAENYLRWNRPMLLSGMEE